MTGKQTLIALSAAIVIGVAGASVAQANDNTGEYHGGFVIPDSMSGVNPAYHPGWFGPRARRATTGSNAYGYAARPKNPGYLEQR